RARARSRAKFARGERKSAMARTGAGDGRRRTADTRPQGDVDRIIHAALARVATEGWRHLSLAAIAAAAELPILQVYRIFGSKQAILSGFYRRVDEMVLAQPPPAEAEERPRDRLFDLLMRRFDALQPHKPALEVLRRELPSDPAMALCAVAALLRSMRWMLEAADIVTGGLRGALAVSLTASAPRNPPVTISAASSIHRMERSNAATAQSAIAGSLGNSRRNTSRAGLCGWSASNRRISKSNSRSRGRSSASAGGGWARTISSTRR